MRDIQKIIDELIVKGARITENGRLDFPDQLPFCPDKKCIKLDCIYRKLRIYLESNQRLWEKSNLAIGNVYL